MIIRESTIFDALGIAKVQIESWRSTFCGIVSDEYLKQLSYEQLTEHFIRSFRDVYTIFGYVAEVEPGEIVGYAAGGRERTGNLEYEGELYATYILDSFQRKGIGLTLIQAVAERLHKIGIRSILVWVLKDNPNCSFYQSLGAKQLETRFIKIGGHDYKEVSYGWEDINQLLTDDTHALSQTGR